jgi:hypothetical protein
MTYLKEVGILSLIPIVPLKLGNTPTDTTKMRRKNYTKAKSPRSARKMIRKLHQLLVREFLFSYYFQYITSPIVAR